MLGMGSGSSFLYAIATRWVVDWVMKQVPRRWNQKRGLMISIGVLVLALSPAIYDHMSAQETNYYQLLEVPVGCTPKQLKEGYRAASLKYHPDKLGELTEEEKDAANLRFQRVREGYETLGHQTTKSIYDRFGPAMLERSRRPGEDSGITQALVDMAVYFATMIVITFLMTLGRGSTAARKWSYTGLTMVLVAEVAVKFGEWNPAATVLQYMTPHEKIAIVKIAFVSFMQGCHVLASVTYVDMDKTMQMRLNQIAEDQKRIVAELRIIRQLIGHPVGRGAPAVAAAAPTSARGKGKGKPTPAEATAAATAAASPAILPAALRNRKKKGGPGTVSTMPKQNKGKQNKAAAGAGAGAGAGAAAGAADGAGEKKKGTNITGLLYLVGIFLFYKYVIG